MKEIAKQVQDTVTEWEPRLRAIADHVARFRPGPDEWSAKEIVGHLIDSASNNHQRFVRLQIDEAVEFPGYSRQNEQWVSRQDYQNEDWQGLIDLWAGFNRHLAHVISRTKASKLQNRWKPNRNGEEVTLEFLVEDYLRHLQDHIKQLTTTLEGAT